MTRHKAAHTGLGTPSPLDRWINALLRVFAMLVSHVARRFASRNQTPAAECDGSCEPVREANFVLDPHQEPKLAAASGQLIEALILRTIAQAIVDSKHEGGLRTLSARAKPTTLPTSHPRASPEDLGWPRGGTPTNPHTLPTEILGTS